VSAVLAKVVLLVPTDIRATRPRLLQYLLEVAVTKGDKPCEMESEVNHNALGRRAYAMKKHRATRLHYDLRLEWNGVLLSWALPEGPNCYAGVLREAIEMEDHRVAYLLFEGLHETGPIMLWDRGTWEPHPEFKDIESCLRKGILQFTLYGEKLKGGWMLARTNRTSLRPVWTLSKLADSFAESEIDKSILEEQPNSIRSGRNLEQIVRDWTTPKSEHQRQINLFDET
jgi:bifunctional non-homologous end joining protein LigD